MPTVQADVIQIQEFLHDAGTLWPTDELVRVYNDAYRRFLIESNCVKDFACFDVPPRNAYTYCYEWEDSVLSGPNWMCMLGMRTGAWRGTTRWEAQQAENVATTTGESAGLTQQWERAYVGGDADRNYDLVFPKNANNPSRVRFNNRIMLPITTLELDQIHLNWPTFVGQPYWYTSGLGRISSIEIYRIQTNYVQSYQLAYDAGREQTGMARNLSGTRTYQTDLTASVRTDNLWAYTTSGDTQAIAHPDALFAPQSASTAASSDLNAPSPAYRFTIDLTMNDVNLTYTVVHPWELGSVGGPAVATDAATPGLRCMYPWEGSDQLSPPAWQALIYTADPRIAMIGLGWRCTGSQATDTGASFCQQTWEEDTLNGAATIRVGGTIGTFSWENAFAADQQLFAVGAIRSLSSQDRQYVPVMRGSGVTLVTGTLRDWGSSDNTFFITYTAFPQSPLQLTQVPDLLAPQLQKYLRYYVLGEAFGRSGEGYQPALAAHLKGRYKRGVTLMRKLADVAFMDRIYVRDSVGQTDNRRTPLVGLPPQYERIW